MGCHNYLDRSKRYDQANNATESLLKSLKVLGQADHWLESCGSTKIANEFVLAGLVTEGEDGSTYVNDIKLPEFLQLEDCITNILNDPRKANQFKAAYNDPKVGVTPGSVPGNRVIQWHPVAAKFFGIKQTCVQNLTASNIIAFLGNKIPVGFCFKNPGHFSVFSNWDSVHGVFEYWDSWGGRVNDGTNGFNRIMKLEEFDTNVKNLFTITEGVL